MTSIPWIVFSILLLGIITFFYRFSFISTQGKKIAEKIPEEFLRLLGPATFTAIIANNILSQRGNPEEFKLKIIVASISVLVAYFTKSILGTLVFGLALLYILQNYI